MRPMITRILVSKKLIAGFRKKAIAAYPQEYMITLWGRVEGASVIVLALHTPHQVATTEDVKYQEGDALSQVGGGLLFLGTCHSHPDSTDATPSQADWDASFQTGEHVFGVMKVKRKESGKFETELAFWEPRPGISIIYPRVRQAKKIVEVVVESSN